MIREDLVDGLEERLGLVPHHEVRGTLDHDHLVIGRKANASFRSLGLL